MAHAEKPIRYLGLCEASAVARLDDTHFAVASDDSRKLRVYETGTEKPASEDFEQPGVTDIEGAARIDETIFWVTSHSLNSKGKDKAERKMLFATKVSGTQLKATGKPYRSLRADIAKKLGVDEKDIEKQFNIEGLAATPSRSLLVGLRGPLDSESPGRGYVVEITNPFALVEENSSDEAEFGEEVHRLTLFDPGEKEGRGIRSLELAGDRYIIVAGGMADIGPSPRIYSWDGIHDSKLVRLPDVDLGGLVPEGIVAWGRDDVQFLGDNGDVEVDKTVCRDKDDVPPNSWFPSMRKDPGTQ